MSKDERKAFQFDEQERLFGREVWSEAARMVSEGKKLPLKNDITFKMFLTDDMPESNECLRLLLSALIGREVETCEVKNPQILPDYFGGKYPRMDVYCKFDGGQRADIELQLTSADDDQALRALFYACKLYSGTLKEGEYYKAAPHVYQIFLVDFDPFEDNGFYHRAMMRMDDGRVYSDKVQLLFFNLKIPGGMKKVDESLKKAAKWCSFISGSNKAEVIYDLGNDPDWKEEFKMAMKTYQRISDEERAWAYHLSYDRAETDYWNRFKLAQEKGMAKGIEQGIEQGMAKGIEQGMAQGELSGRQKTARNLLEMGLLTQEQISQATGLSLSEVQSLAVL